ncbi:17316_t:CDS:2 [Funneliformis geosporum]|uniref:ferroxidase n=1 Tax=Funneliformis geosporum TaxID=1117311 RepID=A0A9W4SYX2_9GLOM|nr:17316_t:CDS:2 [Funneliformis geosporum]CAI2186486.1 19696_t:CDS:2 [Funneliformis geosporum]
MFLLLNETTSNAWYRGLKLLPCQGVGYFFARNRSFITTRNLCIGTVCNRFSESMHDKSVLPNLQNLILSRFNNPKYNFQPLRWNTGFNGQKSTVSYSISELSQDTYHRFSDITMEHLTEYLENLSEQVNIDGFDVEYSSGVLTLKCGPSDTYVLNKQPPNKQIWLSSPISGPKRYDYDSTHKKWFYQRDNSTLDGLLNEELSAIFGIKVDVTLPASN